MDIRSHDVEQKISITDDKGFVSKSDVAAGNKAAAYTITGPDGYVIGIEAGTPVAPEFRDQNGDKIDGSARVTIQKCDKQGNPIGDAISFNDLIDRFSYDDMRNDPDYFRKTSKGLIIDEDEIVKVFVEIPSNANKFDASESRLAIGDNTSDFGKPVEIVDTDDLTERERKAVKAASQTAGGS